MHCASTYNLSPSIYFLLFQALVLCLSKNNKINPPPPEKENDNDQVATKILPDSDVKIYGQITYHH